VLAHARAGHHRIAAPKPRAEDLPYTELVEEDLKRAWLAHYGAPLYGENMLSGRAAPDLEKLVVDALALGRRDPSLTRALPVLLWRRRGDLDMARLTIAPLQMYYGWASNCPRRRGRSITRPATGLTLHKATTANRPTLGRIGSGGVTRTLSTRSRRRQRRCSSSGYARSPRRRITAESALPSAFWKPGPLLTSVTSPHPISPRRIVTAHAAPAPGRHRLAARPEYVVALSPAPGPLIW
jgi:hypothetical protein